MKKFLLLLLIPVLAFSYDRALAPVSGTSNSQLYSVSAALVIGEYSYGSGWPALPGVKQDADAVASALSSQGFQVTRSNNPTKQELISAVDSFMSRYGSDSRARILIYFAGHGHTLTENGSRTGYIVLKNAKDPSKDLNGFKNGSLKIDYFSDKAKAASARHTLFVFDSCFAGSIFQSMRSIPDYAAEMIKKKAREFITSGTDSQQVPDESVFRHRFIDGISGRADADGDGLVTGSELGMYVQQQVSNYSAGSQTPVFGKLKDTDGEFVFFAGGNAPVQQDTPQNSTALNSEKDRLIAIINKNPGSIEANNALKRLREIDKSLENMPPVESPERKDFVMTATSKKITYTPAPINYPFVVIAPVNADVQGHKLTAAFMLKASDTAKYKDIKLRSMMLGSVIGHKIEDAGISASDDMNTARIKIKAAAAKAVDFACPGCISEDPVLAGLKIK